MTEWFSVCQGAHQNCISTPSVFNLFAEVITREALHGFTVGIMIGKKYGMLINAQKTKVMTTTTDEVINVEVDGKPLEQVNSFV